MSRHLFAALFAGSITLCAGAGCEKSTVAAPDGEPTVAGPESKDLANSVTGHILRTPTGDGRSIVAVSLPELKETVIRPFGPPNEADDPTIHALSGPDDEGRVAYIEDHFFVQDETTKRHLLKIIRMDGTGDTVLFSRPGDAMWATTAIGKGQIGKHLSLSPTGGKVALLSGLSRKQMRGALLHQGTMEIWDVAEKHKLDLRIQAVDQPMSWFPDGTKLAYVNFVSRKDLPRAGVSVEEFGRGNYTGSWEELPAIYIADIPSGETRFLTLGWRPVVAGDGNSVFVGGWVPDATTRIKLIWKRVDVASGAVADATWPGDAGGLIANPTDDLVLYWGLPTTGAKIEHSPYGSFRKGTMLVTLKVADLKSGAFRTVIPAIDPRDPVSFGNSGSK